MNTVIRMAKVVTGWHILCVVISALFVCANVWIIDGVSWADVKPFFLWLIVMPALSNWLGDRLQRNPRLFGFSVMWLDFTIMWVTLAAAGEYQNTKRFELESANDAVLFSTIGLMVAPLVIAVLVDLFSKKSTDLVKGDLK